VPTLSFPAAFARHVATDPGALAVVCEGRHATRAEFDRRSNRLARDFAARGVSSGDLVCIALPNSVAFLEAAWAAWKLGAVPQPLSSRLPAAERDALVLLASPRLVLGVAPGTYAGRVCLPEGFEPDASLSDAPLEDRTSPHGQAIASGGSTGRPKLIVDANPARFDPDSAHYGISAGDVVLVPGPLFHTGPFLNAREALLRGAAVVLMARFDPQQFLDLVARHRVAWVNVVPTMLHRIWQLPDEVKRGADLSSLRRLVTSGAPCAPWLMRAWIDWLGPERVFEAYGGTERIGSTLISGAEWLAHPGSVGRPTGGRKVRILDPDGRDLPPGEIGEVFMLPPGGQGSTYRYVGAEARSAEGGWESLGDLGYLDADGFLYLVDRRTDMIVTGGENVYPAEVEAAIDACPGVRSCAVIGLPDADLGQRIHALVESEPELEPRLRAHLALRLSRAKIPRSFEFVATPLRDDAGKVRRAALRAEHLVRR
jgi:bile acid-coenzyme A ligase